MKTSAFEFTSRNTTMLQHYLYYILVTFEYYSAERCRSKKRTVLLYV